MKKIKIFPKMFIQIFSVLAIIIILVHSLVYFIFPKTYLETRKEKIHNIANEISSNMNGKEIKYIEQTLELYSKSSEIKAFIKEKNNKNEIQIKDDINVNLESDMKRMSLLEISHLTTKFETQQGTVSAVRDVSYHLEAGEVLAPVPLM